MAEVLIPSKGCVFSVRRDGGASFYALSPELKGSEENPILIDGPDSTDQDNVFAVSTLDEKQFIYTFGEDLGNVAISGRILLGPVQSGGRGLQPLMDYFKRNRLSASGKPISVDFPGGSAAKVALTALSLGKPDPEFHIQVFALRGIIVKPPT